MLLGPSRQQRIFFAFYVPTTDELTDTLRTVALVYCSGFVLHECATLVKLLQTCISECKSLVGSF